MIDNAPFRSLAHKGLTVEGYSRAAVQSVWRIPELKLGFDLGGQSQHSAATSLHIGATFPQRRKGWLQPPR